MKVFVYALTVLVASCSAGVIGSFGSSSGGSSMYPFAVGYSYEATDGGHASTGGMVQTNQVLHDNGGSAGDCHGGYSVGVGSSAGGHEDVKTIRVIHEQHAVPSYGGHQEIKIIKVIHEKQAGGYGSHGSFSGHSHVGQPEIQIFKIIYEQQHAPVSASSGYSGHSHGAIEDVKTIKLIHEQPPQKQVTYPVLDVGVPEAFKTIKVIHEQQAAAGSHGSYLAGSHGATAKKVIHEHYSAADFANAGGFSAGTGAYDDKFKFVGALSPNGIMSTGISSYGGNFGGTSYSGGSGSYYNSGSPSNAYFHPSGVWQ